MVKRLQHYITQIKKIKFNYVITSKNNESENNFINKLAHYKVEWNRSKKKIVLTQVVQDYAMCIKEAAATYYLAKKADANIGLYSVATQLEDTLFQNKLIWDKAYTEVFYSRLDRIFLSFGGKVVFRNVYQHKNAKRVQESFDKIKRGIKQKDNVLDIEVSGIKIGDLIYDTYLRFAYKSTMDIHDPFLDKIILQSLHIFFNLENLFKKYNVVGLVNTYTTYIHHGIIARYCLHNNIPVYTVGSFKYVVHKAVSEFPSHQNNHQNYAKLFQQLDKKKERLSVAKASFESRFEGKIDTAIGYMRESSFSDHINPDIESLDWKNTVVILAHCFFDSPHIYRDLVFPDFYEWITFTLDILSENPSLTVLVKEHPNGIAGNSDIIDWLKNKYTKSNIIFIDKKTSNSQVLRSGPKAIITAYGTAAAEFAYQQIPVLSIYDNPFTAYDFINISYNKDQYQAALTDLDNIKANQDKEKIIESYYMQNMFFLNGRDSDFLKFNKYRGDTYSDMFLADYTPLMDEPYFKMLDESIKEGFELCEWEQHHIQ